MDDLEEKNETAGQIAGVRSAKNGNSKINAYIKLFETSKPKRSGSIKLDKENDRYKYAKRYASCENLHGENHNQPCSKPTGKVRNIAKLIEENCLMEGTLGRQNGFKIKLDSYVEEINEILCLESNDPYDINTTEQTETEKDIDSNNSSATTSNTNSLERNRRYVKNLNLRSRSSLTKRTARKIIEREERKLQEELDDELAKQYNNFMDAEKDGETELYRRSLIMEMESELEKMKLDGFIDDGESNAGDLTFNESRDEVFIEENTEPTHNYENILQDRNDVFSEDFEASCESATERNYVNMLQENQSYENMENNYQIQSTAGDASNEHYYEPITPRSEHEDNQDYEEISDKLGNSEFNIYETVNYESDEFGQVLFGEDLEQGMNFLEAYNDDDRELIMVMINVQVDRKNVLVPFNSDFHFQQNEDLILVDDSDVSNRNTMYSTTSAESYDDRNDDDEGISMGNSKFNSNGCNVAGARRETYSDHKGVVRIERIAPYLEHENSQLQTESFKSCRENTETTEKGRLMNIIDEIKSTERKYIADLERVINDYKPYIEEHVSPDLKGKTKYIFGNIEKIYKKQMDFLFELENSGDELDNVIKAFINFEGLFQLYPYYFKNNAKANTLVKRCSSVVQRRQVHLNDKLDLTAYLLTPLQRLGRYQLFLENIHRQLEKCDKPIAYVQMALDIVKKEMRRGNDIVAIESISNSPLNKNEYGTFIRKEVFSSLKPKIPELVVFLFEEVIIFAVKDHKNSEQITYWRNIRMNDLRIATYDNCTIHLTDFTKSKKDRSSKNTYILEAKSVKVKEVWRKEIEDILWNQLKKVKENTLKSYNTKTSKSDVKKSRTMLDIRRPRFKSAGSSIFYVERR